MLKRSAVEVISTGYGNKLQKRSSARTHQDSAPDCATSRSSLAVTVLTGRRPALLQRTLSTLTKNAPLLFRDARMLALANGSDQPTLDVLARFPKIEVVSTAKLLRIGEAYSFLMSSVSVDSRYVLHLEDDWECCNGEDSWFHKAVSLIENQGVGQVRLRNAKEIVMPVNALSHQKIEWKKHRGSVLISKNAHFTFNPSLVSLEVIRGLCPCDSEIDAMRKYGAMQRPVAQLLPGAFLHTGYRDSLADRTGGR